MQNKYELRCKPIKGRPNANVYGIVWKYVENRTFDIYYVERNSKGEICHVESNYCSFRVMPSDSGTPAPTRDFKIIKRHTELWEVHEQYKRRIW